MHTVWQLVALRHHFHYESVTATKGLEILLVLLGGLPYESVLVAAHKSPGVLLLTGLELLDHGLEHFLYLLSVLFDYLQLRREELPDRTEKLRPPL